MSTWYRLPKNRVKKLSDKAKATYSDVNGPVAVWVHGPAKKPGMVIVGTRSGSEVRDVPETMIKRKFSNVDPIGEVMSHTTRDSRLSRIAAKLLREADEEDAGNDEEKVDKEEGTDSLDNQVDKYLADYESEAKSVKTEGFDYGSVARRFLSEAEGDEELDIDTSGEEDDSLTEEDIDVEAFANSVMRLVDNYDSLLEIQNTLLRRASNFLMKNYDKDVVESFKDVLMETHGVEIGKSKSEEEDDIESPKAAEAGPIGGGAGGGV